MLNAKENFPIHQANKMRKTNLLQCFFTKSFPTITVVSSTSTFLGDFYLSTLDRQVETSALVLDKVQSNFWVSVFSRSEE
jgi:hypothetical protein